ncbi:MAG: aspartate carbamoyltransferase regulatory subunit [Candidatus Diapherotrites archaeon]|nr:aspartate carbamoyltransferase regulatory subunit [Candidatus Diapherotrites archaeon]
MLMVRHIENGTVIDHIDAGKGLEVLKVLGGAGDTTIVLAINVQSKKKGKKDILKLENKFLDKDKMDLIAIISPNTTINVIREGKVVEKINAEMPEEINGVLKCINPKCITNAPREPVTTSFTVKKNPVMLKCKYCSTEFPADMIQLL